jgi:very-short-patch-repair endonuclease
LVASEAKPPSSQFLSPAGRGASKERARDLRRNQTDAEHKLWALLRSRSLAGYKFRRQVPVGSYIADFLCYEARLIVEADGGQHGATPYDRKRDAWLKAQGFRILRLWNNEILNNEEGALQTILAALASPSP